jgi:hypothetical protein
VKLIYAATALHNYLLRAEGECANNEAGEGEGENGGTDEETKNVEEEKYKDMIKSRDRIAELMWDDYVQRAE